MTTQVIDTPSEDWVLLTDANTFIVQNLVTNALIVAYADTVPDASVTEGHVLRRGEAMTRQADGNLYGRYIERVAISEGS